MPGVVVVETLGKGHMLLHAAPDQSTRHIADLVSKQYDPFRKVGCGYNQHTGYVLRNLRDAPRSVIPPRMEPGEVPPGVEEELNTLLANFPNGLMASRLLVEFRLFFGKELNMGTSFEIYASPPFYQTNIKVDSLLWYNSWLISQAPLTFSRWMF